MKSLKFDEGPPPETVSNDAPGPSMVTDELISRPAARLIVPVRPGANVMVWLPPRLAAKASASRRVVKPCVSESAKLVTTIPPIPLLKENETGDAPVVAAVTKYGPPKTSLAVAVTDAVPEAIVTGPDGMNVAEAPVAGAVKVTTPPSTGSTGLFGVTLTASAVGNTELIGVDWLLPATMARVNPDDSDAPISTAAPDHPRHAAAGRSSAGCLHRRQPGQCHRHPDAGLPCCRVRGLLSASPRQSCPARSRGGR